MPTPSDVAINYFDAKSVAPCGNIHVASFEDGYQAHYFDKWLKNHNYRPSRIGDKIYF